MLKIEWDFGNLMQIFGNSNIRMLIVPRQLCGRAALTRAKVEPQSFDHGHWSVLAYSPCMYCIPRHL